MRARFGHTLRHHMRDATRYRFPGSHLWSDEDCALAEEFLLTVRQRPQDEDSAIEHATQERLRETEPESVERVLCRLQTFPYVFEVAVARGRVDDLNLEGTTRTAAPSRALPTRLLLQGWHVDLTHLVDYVERDRLHRVLLEIFAKSMRAHLPSSTYLAKNFDLQHSIAKKAKKPLALGAAPDVEKRSPAYDAFPFRSLSRFFSTQTSSTKARAWRRSTWRCSSRLLALGPSGSLRTTRLILPFS